MIPRPAEERRVRGLLRVSPVVGLIGARQVGKTTLARGIAASWKPHATIFDLEDPRDQARLDEPMGALERLHGLVVIDEIQHAPDVFRTLRVLADRPRAPARFLVLGSASPELLRQTSESLAGRISYHELGGLDLDEVGSTRLENLWVRGGFPRSFAARTNEESFRWREDLIRTYVERDLAMLGIRTPAATVRRFWTMLAHYHGQIWNAAELARAFGVTEKTVRGYLDVLVSTFMVLRLQPWHENLGKRVVKAAKVYLSDSGILHTLLNLRTTDDLLGHPKVGASWEGLAIHLVARRLGVAPHECHFWALHSGAELDLLVVRGRTRLGFEIKRTVAPRITPSMRSALNALRLDRIDIVHAGDTTFPLGDRVRALALARIGKDLKRL